MSQISLWGGNIRKLWPAETPKLRDHLLRLDRETRRLRFGMPATDDFIKNYVARSASSNGLVYGYFEQGALHAAAELRPTSVFWGAQAEAAFSVEADWQNRGIGTELMARVLRAARNRGIARLYMNCMLDNRKMQRVAKKFDAALDFDHGEVVGRVSPAVPTYVSLWHEAIEDGSGFMLAALDLPLPVLPAA